MTSVHTCMYPVCVCTCVCIHVYVYMCVRMCRSACMCVYKNRPHQELYMVCYVFQDAVDWVKGDRIVIAPTGKDGNETEVSVHTPLC